MTKTCTKCGETKAIEFFYNYTRAKDGKGSWCKVCQNKRSAKYYNSLPKGVYHTFFEQGDYIGEGIIEIRFQKHKGGYSNVNDGNLTFIRLQVLEYIEDRDKRLEREKYWINKLNPSLNRI